MRITKLLMALLLLLIAMADCSGSAEKKDDLVPAGNNTQIFTNAPLDPTQKFADDLKEAIPDDLAVSKFGLIFIEAFNEASIDLIDPQRAAGWPAANGEDIIITLGSEIAS